MKAGDLVKLSGSAWSSYDREGQIGLLIETNEPDPPWLSKERNFSRVLWHDGDERLYKSLHLEVVNEGQ